MIIFKIYANLSAGHIPQIPFYEKHNLMSSQGFERRWMSLFFINFTTSFVGGIL